MRIIMALLGLILSGALLTPTTVFAQSRGYEYMLNGKTYATNPRMISGPGGCNSDLLDTRTGKIVCPLDTVISPQSVWRQIVWQHCTIDAYGDSPCVGGYVAVGHNCPQRPNQCRYYRIMRTYDGQYGSRGSSDVNLGRIETLGNELWIERPGSGLWKLFLRCHAYQENQSRHTGTC